MNETAAAPPAPVRSTLGVEFEFTIASAPPAGSGGLQLSTDPRHGVGPWRALANATQEIRLAAARLPGSTSHARRSGHETPPVRHPSGAGSGAGGGPAVQDGW